MPFKFDTFFTDNFLLSAKKLPKNEGAGGAGGSTGQGRRLDRAEDGPKTASSCCK